MTNRQSRRSTLPRHEARRRYVEMGELAVLEQIQRDAERLEGALLPVGPFARLDANAVAAREGKTRGAITNLFGSQAAFQAETMALALDSGDWIEQIEPPAPEDFASSEEWLDAFLTGESARGPTHGAAPTVSYGSVWALWLSTVPYGLWNERIAKPSMDEYLHSLARLEDLLQRALDHFETTTREGTTAEGPRLRTRHHDRRRVAQPVPDGAASLRPIGADRDRSAPRGPAAVARGDGASPHGPPGFRLTLAGSPAAARPARVLATRARHRGQKKPRPALRPLAAPSDKEPSPVGALVFRWLALIKRLTMWRTRERGEPRSRARLLADFARPPC